MRERSAGTWTGLQRLVDERADVVLMTAGAAQVASVLPDLTRPPSRRGLRVQAQVRQDFPITGRSRMAAMIFSSPAPQFGQCCMSMSKTRLSGRAQLMRFGRA